MTAEHRAHAELSDDALLLEVARLTGRERTATVRLVAALAELDARKLYLGQGCSSLFVYCTRVLRLSEHAAYGRIEAARASRRFPVLLALLESGDLTLTTLCQLAAHLTEPNHGEVLARARGRSKREVEEIVASLRPRPDVPALLRRLPERAVTNAAEAARALSPIAPAGPPAVSRGTTDPSSDAPTPPATTQPRSARAVVQPLAPERYKLQVTIGRTTHEKLRRVQDLMRHRVPSGDLAVILDRALDLLLAELERQKMATAARPRPARAAAPGSRHIPAAVRREVWRRDGGRCTFEGTAGRCGETAFLEFHHVRPFADGGEATADNVELRCRAHNQYEAELFFGNPLIARERALPYVVDSVRTEFAGRAAEWPPGSAGL